MTKRTSGISRVLVAARGGLALVALVAALARGTISPGDPLFRPAAVCDYLIIAPRDEGFLAQLRAFALRKTQEGLRTRIAIVDSIVNLCPGADSAARMWAFLRDAWGQWGVTWVLLAGDYSKIPVRTVYVPTETPDSIPSDVYYTCLEGDWDANRNGLFGDDKPGSAVSRLVCRFDSLGDYTCDMVETVFEGLDVRPDVYLGRLPASTPQELAVMIGKIIAYENTPRADAPDVLIFGPSMYERTPTNAYVSDVAYHYHYDVKPLLQDEASLMAGATFEEIYEDTIGEFGYLHADTNVLTAERISGALDSGYNFVMFSAHGYPGGIQLSPSPLPPGQQAGEFTLGDVRALRAPFPSNIVSNSCNVMNLALGNGVCFAKEMLLNPGGGAVSYAGAGGNDQWLWAMETERWVATFVGRDRITRLGRAAALAGTRVLYTEMFVRQFWGDPEMDLWTRRVTPADTLSISVRRVADRLSIEVTPALDSVLVCLTGAGGIFQRGYTRNGVVWPDTSDTRNAVVELDTLAPGADSLLVTATVHDWLPARLYLGSVGNIAAAGPLTRRLSTCAGVELTLRGRLLRIGGMRPVVRILLNDPAGRLVGAATPAEDGRSWILPRCAGGVYVVRVESPGSTHTARVRVGARR